MKNKQLNSEYLVKVFPPNIACYGHIGPSVVVVCVLLVLSALLSEAWTHMFQDGGVPA